VCVANDDGATNGKASCPHCGRFGIANSAARTRVSAKKGLRRKEIPCCQTGSTSEVEDYEACLGCVAVLELSIRPDLVRGNALATLAEWRVA
jgi:hypothetical protein